MRATGAELPKWGAWSARRAVARKMYDCGECGHLLFVAYGVHSRTGLVVAALQDGDLKLSQIHRKVRK